MSRPGAWLLVTVPAYQALWSQHDEANHHFRRYSRRMLRAAAERSRVERGADDVVQQPAACPRGGGAAGAAPARGCADADYTPDLQLGPAWLNGVLEQPLRLEARWLRRGRRLPAGLSLLAVLRNGG